MYMYDMKTEPHYRRGRTVIRQTLNLILNQTSRPVPTILSSTAVLDLKPNLCADELVVAGGVGWSYDRRRRRAAHCSSAAAAWLYGRRRRHRRRQTGQDSIGTAHSLDRRFCLVLQGSATSPVTSADGRLAPKSYC